VIELHQPPVRQVLSVLFQSDDQHLPSYLLEMYVASAPGQKPESVLVESLSMLSQALLSNNFAEAGVKRMTPSALHTLLQQNYHPPLFPMQVGLNYVETVKMYPSRLRVQPDSPTKEVQPRILVADALSSSVPRSSRTPHAFPYLSSGYSTPEGDLTHAILPHMVVRMGRDPIDLASWTEETLPMERDSIYRRLVPTTASFNPSSAMLQYEDPTGRTHWKAIEKLQYWKGRLELYQIPGTGNMEHYLPPSVAASPPAICVGYFRAKHRDKFQLGVAYLAPSSDTVSSWKDPEFFEATSSSEAERYFGKNWARVPNVALIEQMLFSGAMPSVRTID